MDNFRELKLEAQWLLTYSDNEELKTLFLQMKEINEATILLQSEKYNVLRMRILFDYLIRNYPVLNE